MLFVCITSSAPLDCIPNVLQNYQNLYLFNGSKVNLIIKCMVNFMNMM